MAPFLAPPPHTPTPQQLTCLRMFRLPGSAQGKPSSGPADGLPAQAVALAAGAASLLLVAAPPCLASVPLEWDSSAAARARAAAQLGGEPGVPPQPSHNATLRHTPVLSGAILGGCWWFRAALPAALPAYFNPPLLLIASAAQYAPPRPATPAPGLSTSERIQLVQQLLDQARAASAEGQYAQVCSDLSSCL